MKKILLVCFTISLFEISSSQITYPSVRDVYDFAVGDTFEYRGGSSSGAQWLYYTVIISRTDYSNDSIIYLSKNIRSHWSGPTIDTSVLKVMNLDSAAYWQNYAGGGIDSTSISMAGNDTTYTAYTHYDVPVYCDFLGTYIDVTVNSECRHRIGLGQTSSSSTTSGCSGPCSYCSAVWLIYAHKTNGFIEGTPDNSLFSGIEEIRNPQFAIRIAPNPANSHLILQLQQTPSSSTTFHLFDLTGRLILQKQLTEKETHIELSGVSKGMYLYEVTSSQQKIGAGKLIVE